MTIGQNRDVKPARFAQKWKGLSQMKKKKKSKRLVDKGQRKNKGSKKEEM